MADRHAAPSRTGTSHNMAGAGAGAGSRSGSSSTGGGAPSTANSVRRNLFQSQLTRRPTGGTGSGASSSSSNNSAETLRLDMHPGPGHHPQQLQHQQYHSGSGGHSRSNSRSGPSTVSGTARSRSNTNTESRSESPALGGGGDIVIRDNNGEVYFQDPPTPPLDELDEIHLDNRQETEKERQRLAEAVRQHQIDQNSVPVQPDELLEAVRASLRAKVAALAEDNWMYEREDPPRLQ
ncbi:hypothetical protein V8F20_000548 [Naviculisporaceae sp. PSN 640]